MDRFFRGFLAGVSGGLAMNLWSYVAYNIIKVTKIRFLDWAAVIIFGHMPLSKPEAIYALAVQLGFSGGLGVLMSYFIKGVGSQGIFLKGIIFGLGTAFVIYAVPALFQVPGLFIIPFSTVVANHMGAAIWGFVTAYSLNYLDRNIETR